MGHDCLPPRLPGPHSLLAHLPLHQDPLLRVHQPVNHPVVLGLPVRRGQLVHRVLLRSWLHRAMVAPQEAPAAVHQVQLLGKRGAGRRNPGDCVYFEFCCFRGEWEGGGFSDLGGK